ncbi:MAG: sigma-70 family RNA polymerase sigma factor [Bryobacterales bacterium]|nr:sigma-70 family RNA polymerase sigma factor [Bryobacterales bacterium]MBV9400503.1 sigma-70 family RNA polymerase sigma factor [Bryobacterales bacterium]
MSSNMGGLGMVLHENDPAVIEACRQGDHDAFALLFEANRDKVYSIALRFSGNEASAMDIAQEAFIKLLAHIKDFRSEARFDTWLYRLVVNTCLDHRRRRRNLLPILEDLVDSVRPSTETVLTDLLRDEAQGQVQEAVARLSPEHRMVVVLRYTEGLSYEEIAEILRCSRGTVASRLNRAHKILARRLVKFRNSGSQNSGGNRGRV